MSTRQAPCLCGCTLVQTHCVTSHAPRNGVKEIIGELWCLTSGLSALLKLILKRQVPRQTLLDTFLGTPTT